MRCVADRCREATTLSGNDQLLPDSLSRLAVALENNMSTMFHASAKLEFESGAVVSSCRAGSVKWPENRGLPRRLGFVYYILTGGHMTISPLLHSSKSDSDKKI